MKVHKDKLDPWALKETRVQRVQPGSLDPQVHKVTLVSKAMWVQRESLDLPAMSARKEIPDRPAHKVTLVSRGLAAARAHRV